MAATSALGSSPGSGVGLPEGSGEPVVVVPHDNRSKTNAGEVGVAQPVNMSVVTAKIGQELVTSLHLIKDIRRLEKYQRDFFLKVIIYLKQFLGGMEKNVIFLVVQYTCRNYLSISEK